MPHKRILVVGTTSDYIDLLGKIAPGRLVFLTARHIRNKAREARPRPDEECLFDEPSAHGILGKLKRHMDTYDVRLTGVACFDCESMELAAKLSGALGLRYPSLSSIQNCRDKSRAKELWLENQVPCPRFKRLRSEKEAASCFMDLGGPCVVKPVDGSGSERVFKVHTRKEAVHAFRAIRKDGPFRPVMMEDCVDGSEYSCDFIIQNGRAKIIRTTRKIHAQNHVFGTVMAYEMVESIPENISLAYVSTMLARAANSLGIESSICMVDFMVNDDGLWFLELSPRPGGDCLPWLIRRSMNLDMLKLTLDFAQNTGAVFTKAPRFEPLVGLRIHAASSGTLVMVDDTRISFDPRVKEIMLKHRSGHEIIMPPLDYDSWNLGHIIFKPLGVESRKDQCLKFLSKLTIEIDHDLFKNRPSPPPARNRSQPTRSNMACRRTADFC